MLARLKPRVVRNLLAQKARYPDTADGGTVSGTGVATTDKTLNNGLTGTLRLDSGSAGRAFYSLTNTLTANVWYCLSFEVVSFTLNNTADPVLGWGTAPNQGATTITNAQVIAGGPGRYAVLVRDTVGGAFSFRLGVGVPSNRGGDVVTVKNIMLESVPSTLLGVPSEYVYPAFGAAYGYVNENYISNGKVSANRGPSFPVELGNVILGVGDSRSDEGTDSIGALDTLFGANGLAYIYANPGWLTTDVIGPYSNTSSHGYTLTIQQAVAGTLLRRSFSDALTTECYDIPDANQIKPDTLLISDLGVNNLITNSSSTATTQVGKIIQDYDTIVNAARAVGITQVAVSELSPWDANASFAAANGHLIQTLMLNQAIKRWAKANGHLFIPIYSALGDSADADKLSDGTGTSPNYNSGDGLHLNTTGYSVMAQIYYNALRSARATWNRQARKFIAGPLAFNS